jgi:hypothetical protein
MKFEEMKVADILPNLTQSAVDGLPKGLLGSRIIRFGAAPKESRIEGGGLIVDYEVRGEGTIRRVVFSFSEVGMWVEYAGACHTGGSELE